MCNTSLKEAHAMRTPNLFKESSMYCFVQHTDRARAVIAMTALALFAGLSFSSLAHAAIVSAQANAGIQSLAPVTDSQSFTFDIRIPDNSTPHSATAAASNGGSAGTDGGFTANGHASATVGSLHVSADSDAFTRAPSNVSDAGGHASAVWADSFIISAAGHAGEVGMFHGQAIVEGSLQNSILFASYAQSTMVAVLGISPDTGFNGGQVRLDHVADDALGFDTGERLTGDQTYVFDFTFSFTFDRAIAMDAGLDVFANVRSLGGGDAFSHADSVANYADTFRWLGGEAFDAAGDLLQDWSAMSASSGFDYRFAAIEAVDPGTVPEPEPILLFGAAFIALQVVRRANGFFSSLKRSMITDASPA
jgi:hypothetical protein